MDVEEEKEQTWATRIIQRQARKRRKVLDSAASFIQIQWRCHASWNKPGGARDRIAVRRCAGRIDTWDEEHRAVVRPLARVGNKSSVQSIISGDWFSSQQQAPRAADFEKDRPVWRPGTAL